MSTRFAVFSASAALALALPVAASAQELSGPGAITIAPSLARMDVAGGRVDPEYTSAPIYVGPFIVQPAISATGTYDTNVFNRSDGAGDGVLLVVPRMVLRANTTRHLAQLNAYGRVRRFADFSSENSEEFEITGRTRFDLAGQSNIYAEASLAELIEPRSTVGSIANAAEPISYQRLDAEIGTSVKLGSLRIGPSARFARRDYDPLELTTDETRDLSYRDTRTLGGQVTLGYDIGPTVAAFARADYEDNEALNPGARLDRSNQQFSVFGGLRGELTPLVVAEIAAGYRKRDFELAEFDDFSGPTYRADVEWYATDLVTFTLQARQTFRNSAASEVPGILTNQVTATGYYDLLRNLRLAGSLTYEHNDFRNVDTATERPSLRLQAQYMLNRNISLGTYASLLRQTVAGTPIVEPYTSYSMGIGIALTP